MVAMTKDMTRGSLFLPLIEFTIPLVLGNLLQLTYNAADSMIVGHFIGKNALAAIGTSNPIMTLILLFTNGICLGAGLLVSYYFGAKDTETLKKQIATGLCAGAIFSVFTGSAVALSAKQILQGLKVNASIIHDASLYLRIIMAGLLFSFAYNYFASMLRSMGDSKSPLIFLAISAFLNVTGDIVFVVIFKLGIAGTAVSTVICEMLSALLCWLYINRKIPEFKLGKKWLHINFGLLKRTLSYGIVSALQQSSVQMGKLVIQAFVNSLGITSGAAFNAVNRTDDYAIIPEQNIAHAMSSVMAQNEGAHHENRVNRTFRMGLALEAGFGVSVGIILFFLAEPIMKAFTTDSLVIKEGIGYLHLIAFMYPIPAMSNGIQGYFRGTGDMKVTLASSVINMTTRCVVCYGIMLAGKFRFEILPLSYLAGWIAMFSFEVPCLIHALRKKKKTQLQA